MQEKSYPREIEPNMNGMISPEIPYPIFTVLLCRILYIRKVHLCIV